MDKHISYTLLSFIAFISLGQCSLSKGVSTMPVAPNGKSPCVCGIFLTGMFTKGKTPTSLPIIMQEFDDHAGCDLMGPKKCQTKCVESLAKYNIRSPDVVCGALDRDAHKERAYLFVKNCDSDWTNTNLSSGREFCCKDGKSVKCPLI